MRCRAGRGVPHTGKYEREGGHYNSRPTSREQLRFKEEIPCCSSSTNATLYYLVSIVTLIYNIIIIYHSHTSVNDMWVSFKSEVIAAIERFNPTKMTKTKYRLPWIDISDQTPHRKRQTLLSCSQVKQP